MILRMRKVRSGMLHNFTAQALTLSILSIVAKHYKTSRDSFNKTAKYWAQAYAGAPLDGSSAAPAPPTSVDDDDEIVVTGQRSRAVELAGLEQSSVNKFKAMGFAEDQIVCSILLVPSSLIYLSSQIDVLKRMNYRGANAKNISDEQVRCHFLRDRSALTHRRLQVVEALLR